MFAVTYQWPGSVACRVWCQPGIGPHTFWSTYGFVLAPVIPGYRPNGQCPIGALVTQTVPVWVALDVLGVLGVGVWVVGVGVADGVCVRRGVGLCGAGRAAGEDGMLCCDEQPAAAAMAAAGRPHAPQGRGELGLVVPRTQQAAPPVVGDEAGAASLRVRGDNGTAGAHRLGQHLREALLVRRQDERPGTSRELQRIINPSDRLGARTEAELPD